MAEHDITYEEAAGNDYPAHEATYRAFVQMTKWSVVSIVVLLVLMALFLV